MRQTTRVSKRRWSAATLAAACVAVTGTTAMGSPLPSGEGLAAAHPGDAGIENHPSVVFVENFETGTLREIADDWGFARHLGQMELVNDVREGSAGSRSLRMTATRSHQGVELWRTFTGPGEGWEEIYLRFDTKFAEDYGANHHYVSIGASVEPRSMPIGGAGNRPENSMGVTIEPPYRGSPPYDNNTWFFYTYWPEMNSWQTDTGEPDGRPNPYYGNNFRPQQPVQSPRGEWTTVEMMLKLNSNPADPDNRDGEIALWINGELAVHFGPGTPEHGFMWRDSWRYGDPLQWLTDEHGIEAGPFEGFRWRHDERVLINRLRLQNYVSGGTFDRILEAIAEGYGFNPDEATVYFNNVVVATEYIGPVKPLP